MLKFYNKYKLELVVFLCGAVVMVLELVGSRVVAPYFGSSLYVWTGLIGVILGSLSAGYYFGGKLSDKKPYDLNLSVLILFAGLITGLSVLIKEPLLTNLSDMFKDVRVQILLGSFILFGPVSFLMGMVSPYAARLRIKDIKMTGGTVGNLYALSTLGSIAGTFAAGFYLIPAFGNTNLMYFSAFFLVFLSVIYYPKNYLIGIVGMCILALFIVLSSKSGYFKLNVLADVDSVYNRIIVEKGFIGSKDREIVAIRTDNSGWQSAIYADNEEDLIFNYNKACDLFSVFKQDVKSSLMIGGAGFTYPRHFLRSNQDAKMDVVEIDPEMKKISQKFFHLKDDPRMSIYEEDARTFVARKSSKYDVVFVDAFNSMTPPYHLTTKEFFADISELMPDDGLVMINLISAVSGPNSKFFAAEYNTLKEIFPSVDTYLISVSSLSEVQNVLIVAHKNASDKPVDFKSEGLKEYYLTKLPIDDDKLGRGLVLTDDYAPVEYLTKSFANVL